MSCSCFTGESFPVLSSVFHHAITSYVTHVRLSPFQLWTPVQPVYFSCWLPQGTSSSSTPSTPWGGDTPPSHPSSLPSTCLLHYCRYRYVCTSFYNIVRVSLRSCGIPKYWYLRLDYDIQILCKNHCSLNLAMLSSGHDPPLPGRLDGPLDVGSGHGSWQLFHPVPDRPGWPAGDWLPSPVLPLALVHRGQRH